MPESMHWTCGVTRDVLLNIGKQSSQDDASKKCAHSKHAAAQSEELLQVVSFNLGEEEYGLAILTAQPARRLSSRKD